MVGHEVIFLKTVNVTTGDGMSKKSVKDLKNYYRNYYNGNFYRDYRYIFKDTKEHKYPDILHSKNHSVKTDSGSKAFNFLTTKKHKGCDGDLFSTLSYYKTLKDYRIGEANLKYTDRLFFDFDMKDSRVSKIKESMSDLYKSDVTGSEKSEQVLILQEEIRNLVLEEDILYEVYMEAIRLYDFMEQKLDLKPLLIFSGSKGFHINVFFDGMQLNQISEISHELFEKYQQNLGLKYLDEAVNKDALGRSQRVQYVYHASTGLLTQPISRSMSYDDVLDVIARNERKPISFNISEYIAPKQFTDFLLRRDNHFKVKAKLDSMNDNVKQQLKVKQRQSRFNVEADYDTPINIDMRDLVSYYGINGKVAGNKMIILCPFHDDHNPSAVVNDKGIYCSTCGRRFNYYDLIAEMDGLSDKAEIMKVARKHSK